MKNNLFKIESKFSPMGDQPKAIEALTNGINQGLASQTLLGVTGSGKTFTIANVIQNVQKPTLVIAHNKTLAAQLYNEFKELILFHIMTITSQKPISQGQIHILKNRQQ